MFQRWRTVIAWAAILLGVIFRVDGAWLNTEANDDHMEVIHVMAAERRIPGPTEFWESFQPPLYHLAAAAAIVATTARTPESETRVAQFVSCTAGLLTLALLVVFVRRQQCSASTSALVIALVSLNPALISTSIQATNDAFVILFTT